MNTEEQKIIDFYNQFSVSQKKRGINERHISILKKLKSCGLKKEHKVLEIGCGIGTLTQLLSTYLTKGFIYANDIAPENIYCAKEILKNRNNVKLEVQDATNFCVDEKFDVIVLPDVLEHIPIQNHNEIFQNLNHMLSQNGFVFIHIPNPSYLEWCHRYNKEVLQIIDQPIYLDEMVKNLTETDFFVEIEKTYSIWIKQGDYSYRVLRKRQGVENRLFNKKNKMTLKLQNIICKIERILYQ